MSRPFNDGFTVQSETAAGVAVAFGYDHDRLVTSAGALTIQRGGASGSGDPGFVLGTTLDLDPGPPVTTTRQIDGFGEPTLESASVAGVETYRNEYLERDALGRIVERRETVAGGTPVTVEYGYDAAGRLESVAETPQGGSTVTRTYGFDANGNRTHVGGSLVGCQTTPTFTTLGDTQSYDPPGSSPTLQVPPSTGVRGRSPRALRPSGPT